ncbi:hypothetical protein IB239_20905 [Pseudomonas sp. PDM12]|uniref:hypothetical protein n=1 Tax=Pseudomonas sp. PDM12 TaxID=2769260 RepID=UPI001783A282|nr:hypothetical protein [Pseudomonas sp. PDM12]MBD9657292.1 hypothetical protein [Pseudomonas sp. PDM12]
MKSSLIMATVFSIYNSPNTGGSFPAQKLLMIFVSRTGGYKAKEDIGALPVGTGMPVIFSRAWPAPTNTPPMAAYAT